MVQIDLKYYLLGGKVCTLALPLHITAEFFKVAGHSLCLHGLVSVNRQQTNGIYLEHWHISSLQLSVLHFLQHLTAH